MAFDASVPRFVSYVRVSTQRQGRSGLGLDAQRKACADHVAACGGEIVREFREVESGTNNERPQLAKALAACRVHGAKLLVATMSRLGRNVAFVSSLLESRVEFVFADFPTADKTMLQTLAVFAEYEARAVSTRTKAALAAAKRKGVRLGGPIALTAEARLCGSKVGSAKNRTLAVERARDLMPEIEDVRAAGNVTLAAVADALNARNVPTPGKVGKWHAATVARVEEYASHPA